MVQVALAVEANPWWKQQVEGYILCAPSMVEKAGRALSHIETLSKLAVSLDAIPVLLPMVHELPDLKAALRPHSTEELFYLVHQKVMGLWATFRDEVAKRDLPGEQVNEMMKLLTHASTLYPLQGELHTMMTECAEVLQKTGKSSILKQCRERLEVVKTQEFGQVNTLALAQLEASAAVVAAPTRGVFAIGLLLRGGGHAEDAPGCHGEDIVVGSVRIGP